ncbi:LysR family transcriptional regulator [Conexibacter sp. SYSU D00693]|uniref:LysR family transcriptional regulator n=1 Tax=Conexibacter sp. SYSU D00693 TaxID=2812560 RepID=UPI00196A5023|nr:LysR family transcriptional regulator [Conexibacter sp. SYSU D00693]
MLDVRRLRVLHEVARRGSFSAAAEALSYTQSAISQQVAALEREAGSKLVERSARGVRLTDAGRALVSHAETILARLADAEEELQAIAGIRAGRLRLAAFPSSCATLMPVAIARFRAAHPGVELSLEPHEPPEAMVALRAGEVDLALLIESTHDGAPDDGFERTTLLDDPFHVALPADHPLADRERVRLADLADEQWMIGSTARCPDSRIFTRACEGAGFEPNIAFQLDDYLAIQGFVAAGMGVSFMPELALVAVRDDIVVRPLTGRAPFRRISVAMLEGSFRSPAKAAMLEVLCDVAAEFETRPATLALAV